MGLGVWGNWKWDLDGCHHSGTTTRKDRATQPMDHGRLRWAIVLWNSIFLHCTIYKYYWIAKTYFALGVLAICCRDAGIKSPPLWIMRKPNRSLRICHTILDSLNMTDLRQIVTFEGDWRKTNKVNQAGLTVSDGSFRCGGFVMQYRVDISTSDHFWTHSLSFLCQVRQGTFSPTS